MKLAKFYIITVGIISIIVALAGIYYNIQGLLTDFSDLLNDHEISYFYYAFYTMSAICMACYALLMICGIKFMFLKTGIYKVFIGVLVFETVYFFPFSVMWMVPEFGMSISAATGVANGGLMFQGFILFPFWAPFVVIYASKRLNLKQKELMNDR